MLTILLVLAVWALLWLPIALVCWRLWRWPLQYPVPPEQRLPLLLPLYGLAPLLLWGLQRVGGESFADYGLVLSGGLMRSLMLGWGWGLAGVLGIYGVQIGVGWQQRPTLTSLSWPLQGGILLLALVVGGVEELMFRGFVVNQLQPAYGVGAMVAIASGLFAMLHLIWDGPAGIVNLPGLTLMGVVLILARWADGGSLGLAWGLHSGWVAALAWLDTTGNGIASGTGPTWLVGRPGYPLTGGLGLGLLLLTGGVLWGWGSRGVMG
ncbi:CPBP family intramembrane glutamic endopeptidase [Halomicronema hongdechloris]|uniref:CPBP family intramembrane glutamic endopeptidase n=1 Tax=Halomicronema hongdechloris TaxID=1209493 RepID=UPI0010CC188F|nr:CPBP family intramembrane glutamic endopeptidase [Halomicronema hongdechloris]